MSSSPAESSQPVQPLRPERSAARMAHQPTMRKCGDERNFAKEEPQEGERANPSGAGACGRPPRSGLVQLEFYETDSPISDEDRDGLAQFAHFLAFLALQAQSSRWASSVVPRGSQAHRALESHFGHLAGWPGVPSGGLPYRQLATFLMQH